MRKLLMAAGLAAMTVAATAANTQMASARDYCEQQKHDNRTNGTLAGGAVGALAGGLLGHNLTGALVGGAVGAVGGNVIAGSRSAKCDQYWQQRGYRYDSQAGGYRQMDNRGQGYSSGGYYNRGPEQRGYDQRGYDQRGSDQHSYDQRGYDQRGYNGGNGYNGGGNGYNGGRCGYQDQAYTDAYGNVVHRQVQVCR